MQKKISYLRTDLRLHFGPNKILGGLKPPKPPPPPPNAAPIVDVERICNFINICLCFFFHDRNRKVTKTHCFDRSAAKKLRYHLHMHDINMS